MRLTYLSLASLILLACTRSAVGVTPSDPDDIKIEQRISTEPATVLLVVADDANTPEAASLRTRVADAVRAGMASIRRERFASCGNPDPAAAHVGDVRVILARPSAPEGAVFLSSVDDPKLAWITQTSSEEELHVVAAATSADLETRLADPLDPYRPLHVVARGIDLLTGRAPPAGSDEKKLVASLPANRVVNVLLASTRDDSDPTSVDDLLPHDAVTGTTAVLARLGVVSPQPSNGSSCNANVSQATRITSWTTRVQGALPTSYAWPCDEAQAWERMLDIGEADCNGVLCADRSIATTDGVAECTVYIDQPDLTGCDAARGWRDPEDGATLVDRAGAKLRRCEIIELTGAALESCRTSLDCSGCSSGFCVTEVPALLQGRCDSPQQPWPLRFPGSALEANGGALEITCKTIGAP
jgi:hypothetical protein